MRGWHYHPLENPDNHQSMEKKSIEEVIGMLSETWSLLKQIIFCHKKEGDEYAGNNSKRNHD